VNVWFGPGLHQARRGGQDVVTRNQHACSVAERNRGGAGASVTFHLLLRGNESIYERPAPNIIQGGGFFWCGPSSAGEGHCQGMPVIPQICLRRGVGQARRIPQLA